MNKVYFGDCRDSLKQMAKEGVKVQTCITSPPYYGLRDYGTGTWVGGDEACSHKRDSKHSDKTITGHANKDLTVGDAIYKDVCPKCGAVRKDSQIGLEKSPQEFVDSLVEVFSYVWDILEDDGTLWVNLGDTYVGTGDKGDLKDPKNPDGRNGQSTALNRKLDGFRTKNLIGIPWRVAFALQDFGWNLRQDIIWHKPNPMPESVQDRCTKSHEYIFLLTKKPHYYFDNEAIKEPIQDETALRMLRGVSDSHKNVNGAPGQTPHSMNKPRKNVRKEFDSSMGGGGTSFVGHSGYKKEDGTLMINENRNKRSVWSVNTKPYKGAHFAVYPEELVEPMVLASTKVGDLVLDPFFGSGTTGAVAQKLGRKWVGCELNKDYEPLQFERLKQQALELI